MNDDRARSIAVAVVLLAVFFALYVLSNLTAAGQAWENWLLRAHNNDGMFPALLGREIPFPPFDSDILTLVVGTVAAIALAASARRWRVSIVVAVLPGGVLLGTQLFKHLFGRPNLIGAALDTDVSYPSGHTAIVLGVSAALLLAVPVSWLRWAVPVLGGWSSLAMAALQSVGYHRPSEVLGTGLLVPALLLLLTALVGGGITLGPRPQRPSVDVLTLLVVVAAAVAGAWNDLPWAIGLYAAVAILSSLLTIRTCLLLRSNAEQVAQAGSLVRTAPRGTLSRG